MTVIGQLTLPDAQAAALTPFAQRVETELGSKIDPVTIQVKARYAMPRYRAPRAGDGPTDGKARGFWREGKRRILLADDLFAPGEPLDETLGHELIHTLFSDDKELDKPALLALITPTPEGFNDLEITGQYVGYPASPEECCCVWGSAAIFGFDPPAYVGLYKRSIPKAKLPELRTILLGPMPVPVPPPVPVPDPCQLLRDQMFRMSTEMAELAAERDAFATTLAGVASDLDGLIPALIAIANRARP